MRMRELIQIVDGLNEAPLPSRFEHSDWGYWVEPDGLMRPVGRHQHHTLYRIGWEALASGRIRVTSIADPSKIKTEAGKRILAADFFAHFVTKQALRSLVSLLSNYEFDSYTISGMFYKNESDMNWPENMPMDDWDKMRIDPRSIDGPTKSIALRCVNAFIATARTEPPPQLDATPGLPLWQQCSSKTTRRR